MPLLQDYAGLGTPSVPHLPLQGPRGDQAPPTESGQGQRQVKRPPRNPKSKCPICHIPAARKCYIQPISYLFSSAASRSWWPLYMEKL